MNFIKFTNEKLSSEELVNLVTSPSCGAISLFIGTTRNSFEDKIVVKLEYEAYESMAVKALEEICKEIRKEWPTVENIAIYHRLGAVPVKEASVVIAISSPHRNDAIKATERCIDNLKKSVPIWKKEIYADSNSQWKENKESDPSLKIKDIKLGHERKINHPYSNPRFVQVKATVTECMQRVNKICELKRDAIDNNNIREFRSWDRNPEDTCARLDPDLQKHKDSKSHVQVTRVLNSYSHRDQSNSDYLTKFIPPNGVEERLQNLECQLSLTTPVPKNIYRRLKLLEDRLSIIESVTPEYIQQWDKIPARSVKKKTYSVEDIDYYLAEIQCRY